MKPPHITRILVIDDDESVLKPLQLALQRNNYIVHAASNGRVGLQKLAQEPVELIITDIYMDVMDGMEIVTAVKKLYPQIKIIAMSGGSRVVNLDSLFIAKMLGADRTIPKPTDFPTLLAVIAELEDELAQSASGLKFS